MHRIQLARDTFGSPRPSAWGCVPSLAGRSLPESGVRSSKKREVTRDLQLVSRSVRTRLPFGPPATEETTFSGQRRPRIKRLVADSRRRRRLRGIAKSALNVAICASQKESLCVCRMRGGGGSHLRTCLSLQFPAFREICREFAPRRFQIGWPAGHKSRW